MSTRWQKFAAVVEEFAAQLDETEGSVWWLQGGIESEIIQDQEWLKNSYGLKTTSRMSIWKLDNCVDSIWLTTSNRISETTHLAKIAQLIPDTPKLDTTGLECSLVIEGSKRWILPDKDPTLKTQAIRNLMSWRQWALLQPDKESGVSQEKSKAKTARTGKRKKKPHSVFTPKQEQVLSALLTHHGFEIGMKDGCELNTKPITQNALMELAGTGKNAVNSFFKVAFQNDGSKEYKRACADPRSLLYYLKRLAGENPSLKSLPPTVLEAVAKEIRSEED